MFGIVWVLSGVQCLVLYMGVIRSLKCLVLCRYFLKSTCLVLLGVCPGLALVFTGVIGVWYYYQKFLLFLGP